MTNFLEYKGYHASIIFDAEDNLFVGSVIGIIDSLSFHGETVGELIGAFHECIDDYLDYCRELGKEPNKEYRGTLNIRLSPETHRQAAICAAMEGKSLNQFIGDAVMERCKASEQFNRVNNA